MCVKSPINIRPLPRSGQNGVVGHDDCGHDISWAATTGRGGCFGRGYVRSQRVRGTVAGEQPELKRRTSATILSSVRKGRVERR